MIVFDGVSLESIGNINVEDVTVSPIALNPVARQRAIRFGAEFVRVVGGERTVTINVYILDSDAVTREQTFAALKMWAKSDKEYKLELPDEPNKYLMCVCTQKPTKAVRKWWERLTLVFTCISDPYFISKGEKSVSCGTEFVALGDAPPKMRIERTLTGSASNQSYSNGSEAMTFSTIPAGNMVIDLEKQTAVVGNTDIMQYYQPSGRFIIPKAGRQTITGTGTVKYRERWE